MSISPFIFLMVYAVADVCSSGKHEFLSRYTIWSPESAQHYCLAYFFGINRDHSADYLWAIKQCHLG